MKLMNGYFLLFAQLYSGSRLSTTPRFAIRFGFGDSSQLPFFANFRFISGDRSQNSSHQPTGRSGNVESFTKRYKTNVHCLQFIEKRQQTLGSSTQTIQSPDADFGNLSTANVVQEPFQSRSFHRGASEFIFEPDSFIWLSLCPSLQIGFLAAGFLPLRAAHSKIDANCHAFSR